ncbi:MAG: type II toxin-antitoxin system RelE/ParE family toxin [Chloroflexi bacterium]|nr:type II toxin-antitoxin system RelE/ParE family toxin [Chloroflexota bacterium]
MYYIDYYRDPDGYEPVTEWLDSLDIKAKAVMMDKISRLEEYGLILLRTNMMKRIQNRDKDFYELIGGRCRIALYHEVISNSFILLHGFTKKRQRETREINIARSRLHEYQSWRQIL